MRDTAERPGIGAAQPLQLLKIETIDELLARAIAVADRDFQAFLTQGRHKVDREVWVLGHFARLYNQRAAVPLRYASPAGDPPQIPSDFAVFTDADEASWLCDVEIFEALNPGRRRGDEWKLAVDDDLVEIGPGGIGGDPYQDLRRKLGDKLDHTRRRSPTWILVYDNLYLSRREREANVLLEEIRQIAKNHIAKSPVEQIWILDGGGEHAQRAIP